MHDSNQGTIDWVFRIGRNNNNYKISIMKKGINTRIKEVLKDFGVEVADYYSFRFTLQGNATMSRHVNLLSKGFKSDHDSVNKWTTYRLGRLEITLCD